MESEDTSFRRGLPELDRFAAQIDRLCRELESAVGSGPGLGPVTRAIRRAQSSLRRPLRLAVMGEFNSGKSTLTNLLLGIPVLPTLALSNTRIPTLVHYSDTTTVAALLDDQRIVVLNEGATAPQGMQRVQVGLRLPSLKACEIMDFPGFSDPWLAYGTIDIPRHRIDAAIWCTFSTQAWKESESAVWRMLPARIRSNSVLAVTNKDLLKEDQAQKVMARLNKVAGPDFREFALISALQARRALDEAGNIANAELWAQSGAPGLHDKIGAVLSQIRRDRLKRTQRFINTIAGRALARLEAPEGRHLDHTRHGRT